MTWLLSSSSDRDALDIVDGTGLHQGCGPHYSRRTPGSRTFTGVGQEIVLVNVSRTAVWAVVRQKTPAARGTGVSRGRDGQPDPGVRYLWRNNMFRNLGTALSSNLIREAVDVTREEWRKRYGELPAERLRTEVNVRAIESRNPGYCYLKAGWERGERRGDLLFLWAPQ